MDGWESVKSKNPVGLTTILWSYGMFILYYSTTNPALTVSIWTVCLLNQCKKAQMLGLCIKQTYVLMKILHEMYHMTLTKPTNPIYLQAQILCKAGCSTSNQSTDLGRMENLRWNTHFQPDFDKLRHNKPSCVMRCDEYEKCNYKQHFLLNI